MMSEVKQSTSASGHAPELEMLRREDKYYLGAGDGLLFAPTHPLWLDRPGYWDGLQYFLYHLAHAFTVTLVDGAGRERRLRQVRREWLPYTLVAEYHGAGLRIVERRSLLPGGLVSAEYGLLNEGAAPLDGCLVAWTAVDASDLRDRTSCDATTDVIRLAVNARDLRARGATLPLDLRLRFAEGEATSWCIVESQHGRSAPITPAWDVAPFADHWRDDGLDGARLLCFDQPAGRTVVYAGLASPLRLEPRESAHAVVQLELQSADPALSGRPAARIAASSAASRQLWSTHFEGAPHLTCSDPHVERCFAYRWYGLRLNFLEPAGAYRFPTCAEGIGFFHAPISYSAWCHARDLRWLHDPARARGVLRTFLQHQRADGGFPGVIDVRGPAADVSYFADWGGSLLAVHDVHPDAEFLAEAYPALSRYAGYLDATRDPERSGLFTVLDPYETGQENMPRYTAVAPDATRQHFDYALRLKGVDLTVYAYRLRRALARSAAALRLPSEARAHDDAADRTADAVRSAMWDADAGMFFDVDPATGRRTGVRAAVCFHPYMTDIAGPGHLAGLARNLFDPARFWLPFPVPTTAADEPGFSDASEWEGLRRNCAWNGRVWPMANAHVAEALAAAALLDPALRSPAADFLLRTVRLLFFDDDAARPNSFEHYSPRTGRPALYRGIDDYQHAWILDLIVRLVAGFRPAAEGGFNIDPLPCGIAHLQLERLPYRGDLISLRIDEDEVEVTRGHARWTARIGQPHHVPA